jgi:hypothetical protein
MAGVLGGLGDHVQQHPARRPAGAGLKPGCRGSDWAASRSGSCATSSPVRCATCAQFSSRPASVSPSSILKPAIQSPAPASSQLIAAGPSTMNRIHCWSVSATCLIRPPKAQLAGRGLPCGLLVGQAASGITQEVALPGQGLQQVGTFAGRRIRCAHRHPFVMSYLVHQTVRPGAESALAN